MSQLTVKNSGKGLCIAVTLDCQSFAFTSFNIKEARFFNKEYQPLSISPAKVALFACDKESETDTEAVFKVHASAEMEQYGKVAQEFVDKLPAIAASIGTVSSFSMSSAATPGDSV